MRNPFRKKENSPFCLIRRSDPRAGIGSFLMTNLCGILYSVAHDMIPVIDMKSHPNIYLNHDEVGRLNAWEMFFDQPMGYGIADITGSPKIIDGTALPGPNQTMDFLTNKKFIAYCRNLSDRYIVPNEELSDYLASTVHKLVPRPGQYIGVLCRGSDYISIKPQYHPVQPDVEDMIMLVRSHMEVNTKVFLATEDRDVLQRFRQEFPEQLSYHKGATGWVDHTENEYIADHFRHKSLDRKKMGMDYLVSLYCLSKCSKLIAGRTSGSVMAHIFASEEQSALFVNRGTYGYDDTYSV